MARTLSILEQAHILKSARENGWENPAESREAVRLTSARHPGQATVWPVDPDGWSVEFQGHALIVELRRDFPHGSQGGPGFEVADLPALGGLLRRAAALAFALPNNPEELFHREVEKALAGETVEGTERERMVRERIGQATYRKALLDYWKGACAVTGVTVPEALRASHAKPWAECASDAERLDVYNGFLLVANLDALFDKGLISFSEKGALLLSPRLPPEQAERLGCRADMALRDLHPNHGPFLAWHRVRIFLSSFPPDAIFPSRL